jgi:hypothetical protein
VRLRKHGPTIITSTRHERRHSSIEFSPKHGEGLCYNDSLISVFLTTSDFWGVRARTITKQGRSAVSTLHVSSVPLKMWLQHAPPTGAATATSASSDETSGSTLPYDEDGCAEPEMCPPLPLVNSGPSTHQPVAFVDLCGDGLLHSHASVPRSVVWRDRPQGWGSGSQQFHHRRSSMGRIRRSRERRSVRLDRGPGLPPHVRASRQLLSARSLVLSKNWIV